MRPDSVLVIGGTRGIGAAIAQHFADVGSHVTVFGRSEPRPHSRVSFVSVDVGNVQWKEELAAWMASAAGTRLVVLSAAQIGPVGPVTAVDTDHVQATLDVNVLAAFTLLSAAATRLGVEDRVVMLMGGGVGGPRPQQRVLAYTASKAALAVLIETVARDPLTKVPIVGVSPGAFPTDFIKPVLSASPDLAGSELLEDVMLTQGKELDFSRLMEALDFICSAQGRDLSGRMLSANRDDLKRAALKAQSNPDLFRLRRVDDESVISRQSW